MTTLSEQLLENIDTTNDADNFSQDESSLMTESLTFKEKGNYAYSQSEFASAKKHYLKGLQISKKLKVEDSKELQKNFYLNLSITFIGLNEFMNAIHSASNALRIDPNNVKALYRRGLARESANLFKDAKDDFLRVLQITPNNSKAREHLNDIRKKLQTKNKQPLGGLFDQSLGLYNDKAFNYDEIAKKRQEEEEAIYQEWLESKENTSSEEEVLSFDVFKQMKKDKLKQDKKENSISNKSSSPTPPPPPPKQESNTSSHIESADDLDEDEQKILNETKKMGYCYFHKELTDDEKKQKENFKPQLIRTTSNTDSNSSSSQALETSTVRKAISSWNSAGTTYEEKDITNFAKDLLKAHLKDLKLDFGSSNSIFSFKSNPPRALRSMEVSDVPNIDGEAQISVVRGATRYIFDLSCNLKAEVELNDTNDASNDYSKYTVHYNLNDIQSIEGTIDDWAKGISFSLPNTIPADSLEACKYGAIEFKKIIVQALEDFTHNLKKFSL